MFGNNKQETLNRINALTNEYQQLQKRIFKLNNFVDSYKQRHYEDEHTDDFEDEYIAACSEQLDYMSRYSLLLQTRATQLQISLDKDQDKSLASSNSWN